VDLSEPCRVLYEINFRNSASHLVGALCFLVDECYIRSVKRYCFVRKYAAIPVQVEIVILQYIESVREKIFVLVQINDRKIINSLSKTLLWHISISIASIET
jgi:hypothetical protein